MAQIFDYVKRRTADVLPKITAKLFPNYLDKGGRFIARARNSRTVHVPEVADNMVTRGGFDADPAEIVRIVEAFFAESLYLVACGMVCNYGPVILYPKITGTFDREKKPWDPSRNPVAIRARSTAEARRVSRLITIELDGIARHGAYIDTCTAEDGSVNDTISADESITLRGAGIEVAGEPADGIGLFLVPSLNPSAAVRVGRLLVNEPSRIVAVLPATLSYAEYFVRIVTRHRHNGGTDLLKDPRTLESDFRLTSI